MTPVITINIESLVKYQIVVCTNGNSKAVSDAVSQALTQLIDTVENVVKESSQENHG